MQMPIFQQHPLIAETRNGFRVRNDDDGLAEVFRQKAEDPDDFLFGRRVEVAGRFIREDQIDIGSQRPRDRNPSLSP